MRVFLTRCLSPCDSAVTVTAGDRSVLVLRALFPVSCACVKQARLNKEIVLSLDTRMPFSVSIESMERIHAVILVWRGAAMQQREPERAARRCSSASQRGRRAAA
jgi:hypothetical protein